MERLSSKKWNQHQAKEGLDFLISSRTTEPSQYQESALKTWISALATNAANTCHVQHSPGFGGSRRCSHFSAGSHLANWPRPQHHQPHLDLGLPVGSDVDLCLQAAVGRIWG